MKKLVFVYGTLQRPSGMTAKATFLGKGRTERDYLLHNIGYPLAFLPYDAPAGGTDLDQVGKVTGELFEVSEAEYEALERYEGAPSYYEARFTSIVKEDGGVVSALMYHGNSVISSASLANQVLAQDGILTWPRR